MSGTPITHNSGLLRDQADTSNNQPIDGSAHNRSTFERIIEKLEAGDLRLRLRHDRLEESSRTIASAVNRAGMAVIAAAGAVTGALSIGKGPAEWMVWFGLSPLSFVAFAIAFASTTAFFFSMWRSK